MNHELARLPISLKIGSSGEMRTVEFGEDELSTHMAIYGGTGKGKSKLLELIVRQIIEQRAGVCVIDPHGDLVEDLMAFVMQRYDGSRKAVYRRINYFEPGSNAFRFRFDPFHYHEIPGESYEDWLKAKVESVARTIIRKQGEAGFEGKPRLERFLTNVLYACGVRVNEQGDHLGLGDAMILLDTAHPQHEAVYGTIEPHLPSEIRSDFEKVRGSKPRQQEDWVESTINRLRSFLSPAVKSLFAGEARKTLDFREIIEKQAVMLVNLRRTRSFTLDQGNAIGGLFINEILEAVQIASRTARQPFYLFIDEASRFVGQDLIDALAQFRKMRLSICLAVQDLSSLQLRDIDMTSKVLSQCGIHITFQQKNPEDLEILGQLFGYPLLDFTPHTQEVDRFDGYEAIRTTDFSSSVTTGQGEAASHSETRSGDHATTTYGFSHSKQESRTEGRTTKTNFLAKHRTEVQETGRLKRSVDDQLHKIKQLLRVLGMGQAVVAVDGTMPFPMNVHHVDPAFPSLDENRRLTLVDGYKKFLGKNHPYCFQPSEQDAETERLGRFLKVEPLEQGEEIFGM
ncbi:MAG: DUF87 domain-containing protein [Planctomycetaceae bacterium]|nr:DUF87 domain-containing protein [Planctomycetaceae bacterium]